MKKVFFSVLSVSLVAGLMTSCGKTTKGKMDNEWNVTAYSSTSTDEDGDVYSTTIANGTKTVSYTSGGTTTSTTAKVNAYTMTISKDGTWESSKDITSTSESSNFGFTTTVTNNDVTTSSGTWSFISKNKTEEFKKNERVIFNTLKETVTSNSTSITTDGTTSTTSKSSDKDTYTYNTGESTMNFIVEESTSKKLVLTTDGNYTHSSSETDDSGVTTTTTNSDDSKSSMTLEQK